MIKPLQARVIREDEKVLVNYLLSMAKYKSDFLVVPVEVYTMNDGGMGSIRFVDDKSNIIYKRDLVNADYIDEDNVPVFLSLNLNSDDQLFELDIFKGNFSPLKKYPTPLDLHSIR